MKSCIKLFTGQVLAMFVLLFLPLQMAKSASHREPQARVRGYIVSPEGKPLAGAKVQIVELDKSVLSDERGMYHLMHLPQGKYTLKVHFDGLPEKYARVHLRGKNALEMNVQLEEMSSDIEEIVVLGSGEKAIKRESTTSSRLPLLNIENPQVTSVIPKELLQQQVSTDLATAYTNSVGGGVPIAFNQNRTVMLSRGFSVAPKYRNSLATFIQTSIDPVSVERLEVIKGPSATLFGASEISYGGLANLITKKPYDEFGGSLSYTLGAWDLNRLTLDLNAPINDKKGVYFRVNGAVHSENSFQDQGFRKGLAIAPTVLYRVSDKLTLTLDVEYGKGSGTSPVRFNPYTQGNIEKSIADMKIPYYSSFANNDLSYTSAASNIILQAQYQISPQWRSLSSVSRTHSGFDGYTTQLVGIRTENMLRAQVTVGSQNYYSTNVQQNFIGDFTLAGMRNRLLIGFDYYNYKQNRNTRNVNTATADFQKGSVGLHKTLNRFYVDSVALKSTATYRTVRENTYAAYVSDVLNVTPSLSVMLSLRLDRFENKGTYNHLTGSTSGDYGQTALSPKLGAVYQLIPQKLAFFTNYMNGFTNQTGTDIDGNTFKPEHANQWETGLKFDLWNDKLAGSVSYYDINVRNILRPNPTNADYSIQDGSQYSRGVEVDIAAAPFAGWQIIAGYAYNDSRYTHISDNLNGLRPASSGPAHLVNLWSSYSFGSGLLRGLGIGVGFNYGNESFHTNTSTAKITIPAYSVLSSSVFYNYKNVRLALKMNNMTNEKYWSYRLAPQKPFHILGNIVYNF